MALGADSLDVCDDFAATALLLESDLDVAAQAGRGQPAYRHGCRSRHQQPAGLVVRQKARHGTLRVPGLGRRLRRPGRRGPGPCRHHAGWSCAPVSATAGCTTWKAAGAKKSVAFADPIGTVTVRYVGHPQPLTLPRRLPELKSLTVKGVILPDWADRLLMAQKSSGLLRREPVALAAALLQERASAMPPGPGVSGLKVAVSGTRQGRAVTYAAEMIGAMGPGTGLPAAIAALLLLEGSVAAKGLLAPEDAIDPEIFVARLLACGASNPPDPQRDRHGDGGWRFRMIFRMSEAPPAAADQELRTL